MKRNALIIALCASACLGVNLAAAQGAPAHSEGPEIDPAEVQAARQDAQKVRESAKREREKAMNEVERARREAEQAVEHAVQLKSLNMQARSAGEAGDVFDDTETEFADTFLDFRASGVAHAGQQPLIVRFAEANQEGDTSLREDLPVMNRILTKTVEGETGRGSIGHAMGIVLSTIPGARRPQSLYLEGYGALFLLNVDFPLMAPETETKETQEKPKDSTWEEAKRELYGQRRVEVRLQPGEPRAEFDAEKVENLKNELLKVLRNAANIRELKAEEFVSVVLVGAGGRSSERIVRSQMPNRYNAPRTRLFASSGSRSATTESTLTIRVKKADATAFAEGAIDLQEFTKRASVSTY